LNVADLHLAVKNVRKHPAKQIVEMKRSYDVFGQYRPIIVASDGECLVGNGFLEMAMQYGLEQVEGIVLPEGTSEAYKKKLMLADNKIFDLGTDAMANVDEILSEMEDFDIPGFDANVLEQLYRETEEQVSQISETAVSGIVPPARVEQIQRVSEARQEYAPKDDEAKYEVKPEVVQMQEEHAGEPYITCPHCGVKIYGYRS
jgi:hypothetical protein